MPDQVGQEIDTEPGRARGHDYLAEGKQRRFGFLVHGDLQKKKRAALCQEDCPGANRGRLEGDVFGLGRFLIGALAIGSIGTAFACSVLDRKPVEGWRDSRRPHVELLLRRLGCEGE